MDALLAAIGVGTGLLAVAAAEVRRTAGRVREDAARVGDGEAVFPLGYRLVGDEPDARYRERLDLAACLWRRHGTPIWSLAGLLAGMELTTAHYSKTYLVTRGVDPGDVRTLEEFPFLGESVETIQEVRAACELARRSGVRRLVVISDLLHLAQIRLVLRSYDVEPILVSTSLTPAWTPDEIWYLAIRIAMIPVTLVDRRGGSLGWLRMWRSGRLGPVRTEEERVAWRKR